MRNHIFEVAFSQGEKVIKITDGEYAFEMGYSPSSSDGKEILSETINLIAQGETSQADIRTKASQINRLFMNARSRWGGQSIKPKSPAIPPVYIHVDGLRSEILNGKVNWHSISFTNWNDGKAMLPIHITRQAYFEAEEDQLFKISLSNDGVRSRKAFGAYDTTIQGDRRSNAEITLKNTTNQNRRSGAFWIGLSALPNASLFNPVLTGDGLKSWTGMDVVTPYVWEIDNHDLDIASGTIHAVILRFNQLPLNALSINHQNYTRIRFRVTMEKMSNLYTTEWHELGPQSYQLVGSLPLPPWYIPTGHGRLFLHMDVQSDQDATHQMELDFAYLMPTDSGFLELTPHGYDLPYDNALITSEYSTYVASGHAYYTKRGHDLFLSPHVSHALHVLHSTNVIGITPSDRTTEVSLSYRARFHTFSDQHVSNEEEIGGPGGPGTPAIPTGDRSVFLNWQNPINLESSQVRVIETQHNEEKIVDGVVHLSWENPFGTDAVRIRVINDGHSHPKANESIVPDQEFLNGT